MVKSTNKRVMITCTPKTLEGIEFLQDYYDMNTSELLKFLVAKEFAERKKD